MINPNAIIKFNPVDYDPFEDTKEIEKLVPINEPQREIWLSCALGGTEASLAYNESVSLDLQGPFDFTSFKLAFEKIVQRHEALRSAVSANGEHLIIYRSIDYVFDLEDISDAGGDQDEILSEFIDKQMLLPFQLDEAPLFRLYLHKLESERHYFTIVIHHLIGDGWSLGIILENLSKLYNDYVSGFPATLKAGPQLSSYVEEQAKFFESSEFIEIENFWLGMYKDSIPELDLPTDYPRPPRRTYKARRYDKAVAVHLIDTLKATGAKVGCSLVNTLLSAFEIFLHQRTGQRTIVVGLPSSGQSATENFELVAHCVNLLPLMSTIDTEQSFSDYLKLRRAAFFDAQDHQMFSFGQLIKKLNVKRDPSRIPLVPVVFNIDAGMDSAVAFKNLQHQLISNPRAFETFEIFLNATSTKNNFVLEWSYNTQLFKAQTIAEMATYFESLLGRLAEKPDEKISSIINDKGPVAKLHEIGVLRQAGVNGATADTVLQLFNQSASKFSDHTALSYLEESISYNDLKVKSDQLASFLIGKGIKKGDIVGLLTERSAGMVVCLLGILKAGGVYLPLDPAYPRGRIEFMLDDADAKILLVSAKYKNTYHSRALELSLEEIDSVLKIQTELNQPEAITGSDLAYIIYTSGSTGKPKGVMITHSNLSNFLISMRSQPGICSSDRLLAVVTIAFDMAGFEIFLPLISGAEVVVASSEAVKDGRMLLDIINGKRISMMQATPSTWQMLVDAGWQRTPGLKVFSGGEALSPELAHTLLEKASEVWNMYGPTEVTVYSAIKQLSASDSIITIGTPIRNTRIYIVDSNGLQAPQDEEGEIWIGGDGVAAGYLGRPDLTNERFVADPYSENPGARLYKTGDLARMLGNGEIQYLGRMDQQVKIRGYRIELGEIESILSAQSGIKQCVVTAQEDAFTQKRLIAYVTLTDDATNEHVLSWKDRWDTLYDAGAASNDEKDINLDDALLGHFGNREDLAPQAAEWLQISTDRIRQIGSKRIYEIGSGAGQILFSIAPGTEYYLASDYAQTAIDDITKKLRASADDWSHVEAKTAVANDFSGLQNESFDLVLIHSVAQYFPDTKYFLDVIEGSAKLVREGGCIFIGDMQGRNSLEMYHAMDFFARAPEQMTVAAFKEIVDKRVLIEDEFLADPAFFYRLPELFPEIKAVDIQLRKGQYLNETTKYHYDIWLYIGGDHTIVEPDVTVHWETGIGEQKIRETLVEYSSSVIAIKNVENARTSRDVALIRFLSHADPGIQLDQVRSQMTSDSNGLLPDLFWSLGGQLEFKTYVRWTTDGTDGLFDVMFVPSALGSALPPPPFKSAGPAGSIYEFASGLYSNKEVQLPKEVANKWREQLSRLLPDFMVPDKYIVLNKLPLTPNGKIDRSALPKFTNAENNNEIKKLPKTQNEQLVADIWSQSFNLESIDVTADFFELGGHSLLAIKVIVALEKATGKRLPLSILFEHSTIEKLARQLSGDEPAKSWEALVPIKTTGNRPPLFLIHGAGLNILLFKYISQYFNSDQPVYGLQALGLAHQTHIPSTLKEIATLYAQEIIEVHPHGPYAIAGYSYGGFLAYEIAGQLKDMGKEIKFLGMMDTYAGHSSQTKNLHFFVKKLTRQFSKIKFFLQSFISYPAESWEYQLIVFKRRANDLFNLGQETETSVFTPYEREIYQIYNQALAEYKLTPRDLQVTLFRVEKRLYYIDDPVTLGWSEFALKGVNIEVIPGDHKTFLYPPNDQQFAAIIQKQLDRTQPPDSAKA